MKKRIELKIAGQVQGVFFRQEASRFAQALGVVGWAKNETDGSVKIVAEGEEAALQKLIDWCKQGTKWSRVNKVDIKWKEATGEFKEFRVV